MTGKVDPAVFKDALILLTSAGIAVPLMHKLKINSIVSFLLLGAILGPYGLGSQISAFPFLESFAIEQSEGLGLLGELGVVFLLFLIGIELSVQRLVTMSRFVFGMGGAQLILCASALAFMISLMGLPQKASILLGIAFALSSTAIVIQFLARKKELKSMTGRASFSILLFQDLAIIPVLFLFSVMGTDSQNSLIYDVGMALAQAALVVMIIYVAGRNLLRPLFRLVAHTESADLFVATTLLVIIGSAVAASAAGASMSLGAFIAGLLISETQYSHAIRTVVEPFKGLLLGLFFFTVGMGIDLQYMVQNPLLVALSVVGLIAIKTAVTLPIVRKFGFYWSTSIKTALLLGPAGEFAFVVIGLASAQGILQPSDTALACCVASLSMSAIPLLGRIGFVIAKRVNRNEMPKQIFPQTSETEKIEALVIGGLQRVGGMACEFLTKHAVRYIAIDSDPTLIENLRKKGFPAFYGSGSDPLFLKKCGLMTSKSVIITCSAREEINTIVNIVHGIRPDVQIISRANDSDHAIHLYKAGVYLAVPETIEASLQLAEAALLSLERDETEVVESINEKRGSIREKLQKSIAA